MELDLGGLEYPEPTVKAVNVMKRLRAARETLVVKLDDPVCTADIPCQAGRVGFSATTEESGPSEWTITLHPVR